MYHAAAYETQIRVRVDETHIIPKTHNTIKPFLRHELIYAFISNNLKKMSDLYFDKIALRTDGTPYTRRNKIHDSEFITASRVGCYKDYTNVIQGTGKARQSWNLKQRTP